jgi:hypothetical protein
MGLDRLLVTVLGLGLIVTVNLYFFGRPREQRPRLKSPPASADDPGSGPGDPAGRV